MATTPNSIITPQSVGNGIAALVSPTAVTARTNIVGTTGLVLLKAATTNGCKVRRIVWRSAGTSSVGILSLWVHNGTTSFLFDELELTAMTPSTTLVAANGSKAYDDFMLAPTEALYASVTVMQSLNVFAQCSDL